MKSKVPLQASFLVSSNLTLKDIKAEIILTFVSKLFDDYGKLKDEIYCQDRKVLSIVVEQNDDKKIDEAIDELSYYLKINVIQQEYLLKIFKEASFNQQNLFIAKRYEPYGVYYEKLGKLFNQFIPNGSVLMPEYLGLLLIYYYKTDAKQSFYRFPFIDSYKIEEILEIYREANMKIKKELVEKNPNSRIWEHRTVFDSMEKVASKAIKGYNLFSYKLNVTRKSKIRCS